jgi:hypothetical protein
MKPFGNSAAGRWSLRVFCMIQKVFLEASRPDAGSWPAL